VTLTHSVKKDATNAGREIRYHVRMYILQLCTMQFICDVAGTLSLYRFYIQTRNCLGIIKQCFSNSAFIVFSFCAASRHGSITLEKIQLNYNTSAISQLQLQWKKHSEWRKHCALAAVVVRRCQKFCTAADQFPGARDGQNLTSWRWSLPLPTNPVWWGSMHAISS